MGADKGAGACQVVTRDLRRPSPICTVSRYSPRRSINAYYPDFAYRVDVKRKCLQVLSVVGPSKFVQGAEVEGSSCFNRLRAEGEAKCIEEYSTRLGYRYSNTQPSTFYFPAIFECLCSEDAKVGEDGKLDLKPEVKWVNPLPFDSGAEDLVMSLARHASEWIAYFQRNISKLHKGSSDHTKLSLVLQLDVINCESWTTRVPKSPHEARFVCDFINTQGAAKKQKGVRYRSDRRKWVAEYNPPGKKNNKISLGEYDGLNEAARAADAGMFCYGSKQASYNFDDSPRFLQQHPQPVTSDKEAVRKWARNFAKMMTNTSPSPSMSGDGGQSSSCLSFGNDISIPTSFSNSRMLQHLPSSNSTSNLFQVFPRVGVTDYELLMDDCDSGSALSFPDVAQHNISRDTSNPLDQECTQMIVSQDPAQIVYPDEALFQNNFGVQDVDCWVPPLLQTTLIRTSSDGNWASDDLFPSFPPPSNPEVERCSIQLIR
uniref:AP2/ERF domain-containing protein n=1 Tax=Physcomitrium patens TaxID=3218 RepID=A0A2K1KTL2_PHYPA|nr:hypothetical protein PHYPA_004102 [Physcomitrium patens]